MKQLKHYSLIDQTDRQTHTLTGVVRLVVGAPVHGSVHGGGDQLQDVVVCVQATQAGVRYHQPPGITRHERQG